jgi:nicotinamide-nucleotide amidase
MGRAGRRERKLDGVKAAIIAVGSELLGPGRLDTNSLKITAVLEQHGVMVVRKSVVGDDKARIVEELKRAIDDAEIILVTGGLGPTEDDCTKDAVAEACSLGLELDQNILAVLQLRFAERGIEMPSVNQRQAYAFPGQRTLANPRGTAPGFHVNLAHHTRPRHLWILPGVPWEMEGMLSDELEPWLDSVLPRTGVYRRTVKITGLSESAVEEKLESFYRLHPDDPITILSSTSEIQLHLTAEGSSDEAFSKLTGLELELRDIFGERVYGIDDDQLELVVGRMLIARSATVSVAESCTGGLLGSRITDASGSSAYFLGGVVVYSRAAKERLGLAPELIDEHGEVSEAAARAMAEHVRAQFGSVYGIGITGIAGPTGGTKTKPVGTVHVAVASEGGTRHRTWVLPPPRQRVKHLSTQIALDLLRVTMLRRDA